MMLRSIWWLINIASALALLVILLGAWTRISDAGLSCPDWPGCYGHMLMPTEPETLHQAQNKYPETPLEIDKVVLEMGHRYLAGILGVMIAVLACCAYWLREEKEYPVIGSYLLLGLVVLQALFGMWTVTLRLYPPVVTLHLLGGVVTLTGLLLLRIRIKQLLQQGEVKAQIRHSGLLRAAILVLLIQIILGGWTSSNYAGPACAHWFTCSEQEVVKFDFVQGYDPFAVVGPNYQGGLLPIEARAAIQMGHRIGALAVVIICCGVFVLLVSNPITRWPVVILLTLLAGQLMLGVLNVLYAVPAILAMMHHIVAVSLLLALLWIYSRLMLHSEVGRYE